LNPVPRPYNSNPIYKRIKASPLHYGTNSPARYLWLQFKANSDDETNPLFSNPLITWGTLKGSPFPMPGKRKAKQFVRSQHKSPGGWSSFLRRRLLPLLALALFAFYATVIFLIFALRWVDPPTTAVMIERRVESWFSHGSYHKDYRPVPLSRISKELQHAVISAEDGRFYQHHGFDWKEIDNAVNDDLEGKRLRGASTITQQLVKNLFLTTSRTTLRKAVEFTIVPLAEGVLGKERILELYLNVIEWGPGVYGAEAAAHFHYHKPALALNRDEGARLAAILPAPRRRKPALMNEYAERIRQRMSQAGW
jgi:monofunctional biosynthetic peptidoglycan transglycosylase